MAVPKETVLYYNQISSQKAAQVKSVLVRMGIRIKNISPEQITQKVGFLAGLPGYGETKGEEGEVRPEIPEEMLVMKGFSSGRVDELIYQLKRAKVPKVELKAVVTESNSNWSFYELYQEIKKEHESFNSH